MLIRKGWHRTFWSKNLYRNNILHGRKWLSRVRYADLLTKVVWRKLEIHTRYGNTGCGVFEGGIQNYKGFLLKINFSQMKLPNVENWSSGELSKVPKFDFQSLLLLLCQQSSELFWFFPWKNTILGAHFLLVTFFDNFNF